MTYDDASRPYCTCTTYTGSERNAFGIRVCERCGKPDDEVDEGTAENLVGDLRSVSDDAGEVEQSPPPSPATPFPPHNPDYPDVNPATGDERQTTIGPAVDPLYRDPTTLPEQGECVICGGDGGGWDGFEYVHGECFDDLPPDGGVAA